MSRPGIVINRMYVGDYLSSNLGHEIINLFQADNGCHYLYLNASGSFASEHTDVGYMLMVKNGPKDCFEVIGVARGLEYVPGVEEPRKRDLKESLPEINEKQKKFIYSQPGGDIRYAGVSILDIFNKAEQQNVFITYKAREVMVPKEDMRIYLHYSKDGMNHRDDNNLYITIKEHNQPKTSLKSYIYPSAQTGGSTATTDYDNILQHIIENDALWRRDSVKKVSVEFNLNKRPVSLFQICGIQDDENRISNALAYFMKQPEYRNLWIKFFQGLGIYPDVDYEVEREVSAKIEDSGIDSRTIPSGGRIDLLIRDANNLIVIENKIKSDINTIESDDEGVTQLTRYVNYIEWLVNSVQTTTRGLKPHFLILTPNYNIPKLEGRMAEKYRVVTYKDLYDYLTSDGIDNQVEKDSNFKALRDVMLRHTESNPNGYLYNEMMEKFSTRLKELRERAGSEIMEGRNPYEETAPKENLAHERDEKLISITKTYHQMGEKIKVKAKAQNRLALGTVAAYAKMFPNGTIEELREAFPNSIAPDKGVPEMFISEEESLGREADGSMKLYFSKPEEMISLGDGNRVALCTMWTGKSLERLKEKAAEFDIVLEKGEKPEGVAGYDLEYLNGWTPPTQIKKGKGITVTPTTTVADIKEEFKKDFDAALKVYDGRNVAADDANLLSLGAKTGVLECRASRTVGSFIEEAQTRLGLTVTVWTANEWVKVIDGVTLAKIKQLPKQATKADMESLVSYKR